MATTRRRSKVRPAPPNWQEVAQRLENELQEAIRAHATAQTEATRAWAMVNRVREEITTKEQQLKLTAQQDRARLLAAIDETIADHTARLASLQALRKQFEA